MDVKTDYSAMTDTELDKLAAGMVGWSLEPWSQGYAHDGTYGIMCWINGGKDIPFGKRYCMFEEEFTPTHPDSNQAERYLFPKILARHDIDVVMSGQTTYVLIQKEGNKVASKLTTDPDKINRTKVIACLEAYSKLGEST